MLSIHPHHPQSSSLNGCHSTCSLLRQYSLSPSSFQFHTIFNSQQVCSSSIKWHHISHTLFLFLACIIQWHHFHQSWLRIQSSLTSSQRQPVAHRHKEPFAITRRRYTFCWHDDHTTACCTHNTDRSSYERYFQHDLRKSNLSIFGKLLHRL